jgi:two-component system sensor histidine kinase YesM
MLAIFIILAAFTATFISRNITDPVFKLSAAMEENRTSGELKKIDVKMSGSELEMLEGDYNNMIDHVNELIDRLMEKEKTLQRAEMRVLQEQIKPHFLYNSIETIGFMALDAGADKVHDALETMGSFYRNFLSKGDREIPLSREISIVKDYLSLQKLRYGDIIEDEYEIASEAESFIVPKLILQPLAENSIYHGIRMKGEKGLISFKAGVVKSDDESSFARELHIYVTDTGVGMDREKIKKILSVEKKDRPKEADESFGLWGTVERIRMYTGMDDCVKIESEPGEYTKIEITIPDMSVRMQEAMSR